MARVVFLFFIVQYSFALVGVYAFIKFFDSWNIWMLVISVFLFFWSSRYYRWGVQFKMRHYAELKTLMENDFIANVGRKLRRKLTRNVLKNK